MKWPANGIDCEDLVGTQHALDTAIDILHSNLGQQMEIPILAPDAFDRKMFKGLLAFARVSGTRCKLNKLLSPVNQAVGSLAKGKIIRKKMALAEAYVEEVDKECEALQLPSDLADILQADVNDLANELLVVYAESLQLAASLLTPLTTASKDPELDFDAEFDKELIDDKVLNQMVNGKAAKTLRDLYI